MNTDAVFRAVLHATEFSAESDVAFTHALKIAASASGGGRFTIIHATQSTASGPDRSQFPSVHLNLERWGLLPPGSHGEDVFNELGVAVDKVDARGSNVVAAINGYIETHAVDLLVLATRGGAGLPRWIQPSVSERLARLSKTTTLFVPQGARRFVSAEDGAVHLRRILIPITTEPDPQAAVGAACALARTLSREAVRVDLLHVGEEGASPFPLPATDRQITFHSLVRTGDIVNEISAAARQLQVDLIAMSTHGHHGFLDALRGSTTEQVIRRAPCPVLAAPITGHPERIWPLAFSLPGILPSTS